MLETKIVYYVYPFDHHHLQWCIVPFLFRGAALRFRAASAVHSKADEPARLAGRADGSVKGDIVRLAG